MSTAKLGWTGRPPSVVIGGLASKKEDPATSDKPKSSDQKSTSKKDKDEISNG